MIWIEEVAMLRIPVIVIVLGLLCAAMSPAGALEIDPDLEQSGDIYITAWKRFYPSSALANGDKPSAFHFEILMPDRINKWLSLNRITLDRLKKIGPPVNFDDRVDWRILKHAVDMEIESWSSGITSNRVSSLIAQALTHVLVRRNFTADERLRAVNARLQGIRRLCREARSGVTGGRRTEIKRSVESLRKTAVFFRRRLPRISLSAREEEPVFCSGELARKTAGEVENLADHLQKKILPAAATDHALGRAVYHRKLRLYTGLGITPEKLTEIAMAEIRRVRGMIVELVDRRWRKLHPGQEPLDDTTQLVSGLMAEMEDNREENQTDFLQRFLSLIERAESFVKEKNLCPVPARRTLFTALSPPHFAGAAVGGVYPAGPFDPEADTILYLPTVPDTSDLKTREGFYRSFNNHFNTMIITHEIIPGHYLQLKMAAGHKRRVRALFGGDLFAEGWASLCEELTLDHGWDGDHPLTRLAHLRKRLENAVRAYVSVRVHCDGWDRRKTTEFAVETGWLPRQFAVNLWHRVISSPLQLTSYFLGYNAFTAAYRSEKERLGHGFSPFYFSKRILESGSVPIDMLPALLETDAGNSSSRKGGNG